MTGAMASQPTKEDVNRAGRLFAELLAAYKTDDFETLERLEGHELERLESAVETIEWWRGLHADRSPRSARTSGIISMSRVLLSSRSA
jgi:hypothetical protein